MRRIQVDKKEGVGILDRRTGKTTHNTVEDFSMLQGNIGSISTKSFIMD